MPYRQGGDNGQDSWIYTDVGTSECGTISDPKEARRSEGKILHFVNTWQLELLSAAGFGVWYPL